MLFVNTMLRVVLLSIVKKINNKAPVIAAYYHLWNSFCLNTGKRIKLFAFEAGMR